MIKVLSHNVRVWTRDRDEKDEWYWKNRMKRIWGILVRESPDIICFQELSFPANAYIPDNYRRVGLSISHPIYVRKFTRTRRHRFHLRWDSVEVLLHEKWITVINVHLHWNEKIFVRCMRKISRVMETAEKAGQQIIACGDWNVGRDRLLLALPDTIHVLRNTGATFQKKGSEIIGEIDFFAVNNIFGQGEVIETDMPLSDHRPVMLSIK